MKNHLVLLFFTLLLISCNKATDHSMYTWQHYDESEELKAANEFKYHKPFKLINSENLDKNAMLNVIKSQLSDFSEEDYLSLKTFIFDQNILQIQSNIDSGNLTYKKLTQWYLFRIMKMESSRDTYLNAIISINPKVVSQAEERDKGKATHKIYGMPILLKDNINAEGMPTSAGSVSLFNNYASNSFIANKLIENGALILGKTNLSEWANFISGNLPNGFSAIGGQTLNPHGRMKFDTGGSSSGSAVAVYANYCVAAVGSETSGSITSPSSSNYIVGLKPSIGLLSRSGIVPISSTLDTPGPMTKNVTDNAILLSAMLGEDENDDITISKSLVKDYSIQHESKNISELRLGIIPSFKEDSLYMLNVNKLKDLGATIIEIEELEVDFSKFLTLLNYDMKRDLPKYIKNSASQGIHLTTIEDFIAFNRADSLKRIPYGQNLFIGIRDENISDEDMKNELIKMETEGRAYFDNSINEHNLDAVLSINNWHAGIAAYAKYPCLTVPMGFDNDGRPKGMTFVSQFLDEENLLKIGYIFEESLKSK